IGTASGPRSLTVTNTGTAALVGGTFTFGGGTPQPFSRATLLQGGPGTCGATLAVGASCTFNVVFTAATGTTNGTAFSRTLTVTAETLALDIGGRYSITGTTCSFTTALAPTGTCTISVRYATPVTQPVLPDIGATTVSNNGTGTVAGSSILALAAR